MFCFQREPFLTLQFFYEYVKRDGCVGVRGEKKESRRSHRSPQRIIPDYPFGCLLLVFRWGWTWTWVMELVNDGVHPGLLSPAAGRALFLLLVFLPWSALKNTSSALKTLEGSLAWHLRPSSSKTAHSIILLRKLSCVSYPYSISKRFPGHWPTGESFRELFLQVSEWVKVSQSCLTLCDPMDCSLPGSSVHGILQARILEWVAMPSCRGSPWSRDPTQFSCIGRRILYDWATREPQISSR